MTCLRSRAPRHVVLRAVPRRRVRGRGPVLALQTAVAPRARHAARRAAASLAAHAVLALQLRGTVLLYAGGAGSAAATW